MIEKQNKYKKLSELLQDNEVKENIRQHLYDNYGCTYFFGEVSHFSFEFDLTDIVDEVLDCFASYFDNEEADVELAVSKEEKESEVVVEEQEGKDKIFKENLEKINYATLIGIREQLVSLGAHVEPYDASKEGDYFTNDWFYNVYDKRIFLCVDLCVDARKNSEFYSKIPNPFGSGYTSCQGSKELVDYLTYNNLKLGSLVTTDREGISNWFVTLEPVNN